MRAADQPRRDQEKELVRSRTNLLELARELTDCEFDERGQDDWWACCPFHTEDSASFHVLPRDGYFKCFGCDLGGDLFRFVQEVRGVDFREALQFLAERAGVTLGSISKQERDALNQRRRLTGVLDTSATLFAAALRHGSNPAAEYMARRGFTDETLERFDVGFVPPQYERLLAGRDIGRQALESAGFTGQFRGRVSFGIRDRNSALVGFGARTLDPEGSPKYVNTRESDAFSKRRLLYGLNVATRRANRSGRLIVMEGYTDVMMAHQCGVADAVATMGTAFTEEHVGLLPQKVNNLVFVFDGDAAGEQAAERGVRRLLALGRECRVLTLPGGQDPCDWFAAHTAEAFDELLTTHGRTSVEFLCDWELSRLDARQPGAREEAARLVMSACGTLRDPIRRNGIGKEIAQRCGVDRGLLDRLIRAEGRSAPTDAGPASRFSGRLPVKDFDLSQLVVLAGLFQQQHALEARGQVVQLAALDAFSHPGARALLELIGGAEAIGALSDDQPAHDLEEWRAHAEAQDMGLASLLVAAVLPNTGRPGHVSFPDALSTLHGHVKVQVEKRDLQQRMSQPDVADDEASLRELDKALRARARNTRKTKVDADEPQELAAASDLQPGAPPAALDVDDDTRDDTRDDTDRPSAAAPWPDVPPDDNELNDGGPAPGDLQDPRSESESW